jgi:hypothetical protein
MIRIGYTTIEIKPRELKQHCHFNLHPVLGHDIEIEVDDGTIRIMPETPADRDTLDTALDLLSAKLQVDCRSTRVMNVTYGVQCIMESPSIEYIEYLIPTGGISLVQSSDNRILLQSRYGNEMGNISFSGHTLSIAVHLSSRLAKTFDLDHPVVAQDIVSENVEEVCKLKLRSLVDRIIPNTNKPISFDNIRTRTDLQEALLSRFLQSKEDREALLQDVEIKYRKSEISAGSITRMRQLLLTIPSEENKLIELQSIKDAIRPIETTVGSSCDLTSLSQFSNPDTDIKPTETSRIILFA